MILKRSLAFNEIFSLNNSVMSLHLHILGLTIYSMLKARVRLYLFNNIEQRVGSGVLGKAQKLTARYLFIVVTRIKISKYAGRGVYEENSV